MGGGGGGKKKRPRRVLVMVDEDEQRGRDTGRLCFKTAACMLWIAAKYVHM